MKTLSPGSHQPDLSTLFSCVLPQFSPFSCSPPTQRAFSGQDHSADLWSSVVAQLVSLICNVMQTLQPVYSHRVWNCDSKSSHGKTPIAFPHQMAQICHSSTLLLTLPNASSSCLVWVSTFLLTRKEASWERSVWRVILLWESICFWKERSHGDSLLNFPSGSLSTEMNLKLFLAEFSFLRFELIKMLPEIPVTASVFAAGAFPSPLPRLSNSIIFFL